MLVLPPPQQSRFNPNAKVAQQREGVEYHPEKVGVLKPQIEALFQTVRVHLEQEALSDLTIDKETRLKRVNRRMEGLRNLWEDFITKKDGFFLTEIDHFPEYDSHQLMIQTEPLSVSDQAVAKNLKEKQIEAFRNSQDSIAFGKQTLPASPRLSVRQQASLVPHFTPTDINKTTDEMLDTQAVIKIFNTMI